MSGSPSTILQRNSFAHQAVVDDHFSSASPFFIDFCRPTCLSTFTLGEDANLALLLNKKLAADYSVVLVHNNDLGSLLQELEQDIVRTAQWTQEEQKTGNSAYVAVWSHPQSQHSLIGIVSNFSRNQSISLTHPHIIFSSNMTDGNSDDVFDGVEYHLSQHNPMSNDFLTLLSSIGWQNDDPISRMEHLVQQWNFEGQFEEDRSRSLVVQSVEVWAEEQRAHQKQRLVEQIDLVAIPLRKKVL